MDCLLHTHCFVGLAKHKDNDKNKPNGRSITITCNECKLRNGSKKDDQQDTKKPILLYVNPLGRFEQFAGIVELLAVIEISVDALYHDRSCQWAFCS